MKRSALVIVLAIIVTVLTIYLVIGLVTGDRTTQLERNQPTPSPSSTG